VFFLGTFCVKASAQTSPAPAQADEHQQKERQKAYRTLPPDWDDSLFAAARRAKLARTLVNEGDSIATNPAFINPAGAGTINNRAGGLGTSVTRGPVLPPGTINDDWVGPPSGVWSNASNWSGGVPDNGGGNIYNVFIDNGNPQATSVNFDLSNGATINNLTIDSDDALVITEFTRLTVNGNISNAGQITLYGQAANLAIGGASVTLSGGGTVNLSGTGYILAGPNGGTLVNQDNTIQGVGNIELNLVNAGTIDANFHSVEGTLTISPGSGAMVTNTGLIEATNGGLLELSGNFTNTGGTITAGAGSTVDMGGASITGGTLSTTGNGVITVTGNKNSLNSLTNSGTLVVNDNSTLTISGTINNTGTIGLESRGNGTYLTISGSATLTGSGVLGMGIGPNYIEGASTGNEVLTNQSTIEGSGFLGNGFLVLNNQGTIDANTLNETLLVSPSSGGVTNTGTLEATSGGTLQLIGNYTNTNGKITAATGSIASLNGASITGGTLSTSGSGVIETLSGGSGATLSGLTNSGTFNVSDGTTLTLAGAITNTGQINENSTGSNTFIDINGKVTLAGKGTLTMGKGSHNFIQGTGTAPVLTNSNTIQGAGNIGDASMGLINSGTILANAGGLVVDVNSSGFTNSGNITVSSKSSLNIIGPTTTSFSTSGTVVIHSGGTLTMSRAKYSQTGAQSTTTVDGKLIASNGINISGGTVFGNMGTLVGNFNLSGTGAISPGDGIMKVGELSINGKYAQGSTASALIDLGGTGSGKFDVVNITKAAALNGKLIVDLVNGFTPVAGNSFDIMNYASETGVFSSETLPSITGDHWLVTIGATDVLLQLLAGTGPTRERGGSPEAALGGAFTQGGNYTGYVPPTAVPNSQLDSSGFSNFGGQQSPTPEPSSLFLLGSALLGMGAFARRHLKKRAAKR
jgi:hypothetical protein